MTKEELSKRIGELYGLEAIKTYPLGEHDRIDIWLIEETEKMFELAVENDIHIGFFTSPYGQVVKAIPNNIFVNAVAIKDHPTKLEATLYAIGLALVKKAEMK